MDHHNDSFSLSKREQNCKLVNSKLETNSSILTNMMEGNKIECENIMQTLINSFRDYFDELIEITLTELKALCETNFNNVKIFCSKENFKNKLESQCHNKYNIGLSKVVKIYRNKLIQEFNKKVNELKSSISKNLEFNDGIFLDKHINFNLFITKIENLLDKFENVINLFLSNLKKKYQNENQKQNSINDELKYTDFDSDTECYVASKFVSFDKIDKYNTFLKTLQYSSSSKKKMDKYKKLSNYQNSENSRIFYSSFCSENETDFAETDYSSQFTKKVRETQFPFDSENDDKVFQSDSNINSSSSCISIDYQLQDEDEDTYVKEKEEKNSSSKKIHKNEIYKTCTNDETSDCIMLEDEEILNETQKKIKNMIKNNVMKKCPDPIYLGMRLLALRDKEKHLWKPATLIKIENKIENLNFFDNKKFYKHTCLNKYVVKFDSDDEPDSNENDDQIDDSFKNQANDKSCSYEKDLTYLIEEKITRNSSSESCDENECNILDSNSDAESNNTEIKKNKILQKKKKKKSSNDLNIITMPKLSNKQNLFCELDAKCLAYLNGFETLIQNKKNETKKFNLVLPHKLRVVTFYQLIIKEENNTINKSDKKILIKKEYLSSGIIAETPNQKNLNRYLIFFDNGYCSYVKPSLVFPIFDCFGWPTENLHIDHIKFLEQYFNRFPERTMLKINIGSRLYTYFCGKWHAAKCVDVDCSIVKIELNNKLFEILNVEKSKISVKKRYSYCISLYRGSYSTQLMYDDMLEKLNSKNENKSCAYEYFLKEKHTLKNYQSVKNEAYISVFASTLFPELDFNYKKLIKSLNDNIYNQEKISKPVMQQPTFDKISQGQIKLLDLDQHMRNSIIKFKQHPCTPSCVKLFETNIHLVKYVNPLLMPVLHGWQRQVCHQSKALKTGNKKWINYVAPCGRMLRSMNEVDRYLYMTDSMLTIDQFSFDTYVLINREYEANAKFFKITDIANSKENVPISCVNCVDSTKPDNIEYSNVRIPLDEVPLNTDSNLLEGCYCIDNCRDKLKCSCWMKTFEATTFKDQYEMNTSIGYKGRRLLDLVDTGIFECNSKCNCDCRCSNRVVQNGISVRLQLFKTANKGWGLRCLDDIAKGSFICTYAGHLMTEDQSDMRGQVLGDEYFAELDFIECLRRLFNGALNEENNDGNDSRFNFDTESNDSFTQKKNQKKNKIYKKLLPSFYQRPKQLQMLRNTSSEKEKQIELIDLESDNDNDQINRKNEQQTENSNIPTEISMFLTNRFFTNKENRYFFKDYFEDNNIYIMDAKILGNIGRYFNHSCSPNIFVQNVFVDTYDLRFPWIAFFASQSIKAGSELCWDYNYTIDSVKGRELYCYCNSTNCRGRLL